MKRKADISIPICVKHTLTHTLAHKKKNKIKETVTIARAKSEQEKCYFQAVNENRAIATVTIRAGS